MVDELLVRLQYITPNLKELDLEGNDMESVKELTRFFHHHHHHNNNNESTKTTAMLFPAHLTRLYLGSNLFRT
jgi:Leucine-rich repeat (LRR) protein